MKKVFSLLLVAIMCFTALVACNKNKNNEDTTNVTASVNNGLPNELPAQDFGGKVFTILDANDHPDMHINFSEDGTGGFIQAALFQRDLYLSERNNIKFAYESVLNTNQAGIYVLSNAAASGDRPYDMVISTAKNGRMAGLSSQGIFTNLSSLPTLDLNADWWSPLMNEQISIGGKIYFTTGDIAASVYDAPFAVYANRTLINDYQITDNLYQKVKDGEWTFEYLTQITKDLYEDLGTNDGIWNAGEDFFGIVQESNQMTALGIIIGMGFDLSYINDTYIIVNDDTEELEGLISEIREGVIKVSYANENKISVINSFKEDRAVFLIHLMEAANHSLRDMSSDYLVLPMPKGDVTQENYRSYINGWVDCFVGIPTFAEDEEYENMVGYMFEAMARASYDIVRPVAFDSVVKYQSIKEEASLEMLEIIYDSLYIDFQCIYNFGGGADVITDCIFNDAQFASSWQNISVRVKSEALDVSEHWIN